jgi:hypothetical protein
MKYLLFFILLVNCSKDISFDPTVTISKELIKFLYNKSTKERTIE